MCVLHVLLGENHVFAKSQSIKPRKAMVGLHISNVNLFHTMSTITWDSYCLMKEKDM